MTGETEDPNPRLLKEAEDLAAATHRQLYVMVFTGFFLVLTLAGSDERLVRADATISWPLIQTQIQLSTFLTFAPIALVALLIYLHLHVHRLAELRQRAVTPPQCFVFSMSSSPARAVTDLLFYAYVPVILAFFAWKVIFRNEAVLLALTTAIVAVACAVLYLERQRIEGTRLRRRIALGSVLLLAVLTVLGTTALTAGRVDWLLWLRSLDLLRADLAVSTEFPRVNLLGQNLSHADLRYARLTGADLREAQLNRAVMNFATTFAGDGEEAPPPADFTRASLRGTSLLRADLRNSEFECATLDEAALRQAQLGRTNFRGALMEAADLTRAEGGAEVVFQEADLRGALFRAAELPRSNFRYADLDGSDFDGAIMSGAQFNFANLTQANLMNGSFTAAAFRGAVMTDADLSYSDLSGAQFSGADLEGATLKHAQGLDDGALVGARLCRTIMPDDSIRNDGCDRVPVPFVVDTICDGLEGLRP